MAEKRRLWKRILRILTAVILILTVSYGLLLIVLGTSAKRELDQAKETYLPVTVQITELRQSSNLSRSLIVVLKPENEHSHLPEQLGRTIATTSNQKLAPGDRLTMYYDPENPQKRVIDFCTAEPTQRAGWYLTAAGLLILLLLLLWQLLQRRKHRQPAAFTDS